MTINLVTFASGNLYEKSRKNLDNTLEIAGINSHTKWDFEKIKKTNFYKKNKKLLDNKIGYGYWSWKPYIILEKLSKLNKGDILLYMDSSRYETDGFKNSCKNVVNFMLKNKIDILPGFKTNNRNYEMIKPSCLEYFNLKNNNEFKNSFNVFTSPMFIVNNEKTINIIKEWKEKCLIEKIISHEDLNYLNGKIHIYDQAILNCLLYKYNIKSYKPDTKDEKIFRKFTYYFNYFR